MGLRSHRGGGNADGVRPIPVSVDQNLVIRKSLRSRMDEFWHVAEGAERSSHRALSRLRWRNRGETGVAGVSFVLALLRESSVVDVWLDLILRRLRTCVRI